MKTTIFSFLLFVVLAGCKKDKDSGPAPAPSSDYSAGYFELNGLSLTWQSNASGFNMETKKKLVETFFEVYPKIIAYFNTSAPKAVTVKIDASYTGVAYAQNGQIVFSANYMAANATDIDVITHELTHLAQNYPQYNPSWLVEGIADFSRHTFGLANTSANWSLPAYQPGQNYDNSYRITARFLVWIEARVKAGTVKALDAQLRANTYTEASWQALTGKSVQQLWNDYAANPSL
jgi:hypothetical protein